VRNDNPEKYRCAGFWGHESGLILYQEWCNTPKVSRLDGDLAIPLLSDTDLLAEIGL
jgi:hypothetical protein